MDTIVPAPSNDLIIAEVWMALNLQRNGTAGNLRAQRCYNVLLGLC